MAQQNQKDLAWLKVNYQQQIYIPVVVLQRVSRLRSLVVKEGDPIKKEWQFQVDHTDLFPRTSQKSPNGLLQMTYYNLPELKKQLSPNKPSPNKKQQDKKYTKIGNNIIIDMLPPLKQETKGVYDQQLQHFFKFHLHSFLLNNKQTEKFIFISSKENYNPHCYLDSLFLLLSSSPQLWPHRIKIEKVCSIVAKLFRNVSLQIKFTFLKSSKYQNESSKISGLQFKPFSFISPGQGLLIPDQLLELGNSKKFADMYRGPRVIQPEANPSELQSLVDALLSFGIQVKKVHQLMRILSAIINLNRISVDYIIKDGVKDITYKTIESDKKQQCLINLSQLLDIQIQPLKKLLVKQERQQSDEQSNDENLNPFSTEKKFATYHLHTFKYILYEILILQTCELLNQRLTIEEQSQYSEAKQEDGKKVIVFSYSCAQKKQEEKLKINKDLREVLEWSLARSKLENKFQELIKKIIMQSLKTDTIKEETKEQQSDRQQKVRKNKECQSNQEDSKENAQAGSLKQFLSYQNQIKNYLQSLSHLKKSKLEYKQVTSIENELELLNLYRSISNYLLLPRLTMKMLNCNYKKGAIEAIPQFFSKYIWGPSNKRNILFILNNKLILHDQKFMLKIMDQFHKVKIAKDNQRYFDQQTIQIKLKQFVSRYMYTTFCKSDVHRHYPQIIKVLSKNTPKYQKICKSSYYIDHETAVKQLSQSIQIFIEEKCPSNIRIHTEDKNYSKYSQKKILVNQKYLQGLQLQVEKQHIYALKIQRQFIVYRDRKKSNKVVFSIYREAKMQRIISKLIIIYGERIGMEEIKNFQKLVIKKRIKEEYRLQRLKKQSQNKISYNKPNNLSPQKEDE